MSRYQKGTHPSVETVALAPALSGAAALALALTDAGTAVGGCSAPDGSTTRGPLNPGTAGMPKTQPADTRANC
jgi:hypothetical protein